MHFPRIAYILTQSLVKSYMVPYNKQTEVHSLVFSTSWPIAFMLYLLLQTCPGLTLLTSSPHSSHTRTLALTRTPNTEYQLELLSLRECSSTLQLPVKAPHLLQSSTQKTLLPWRKITITPEIASSLLSTWKPWLASTPSPQFHNRCDNYSTQYSCHV